MCRPFANVGEHISMKIWGCRLCTHKIYLWHSIERYISDTILSLIIHALLLFLFVPTMSTPLLK